MKQGIRYYKEFIDDLVEIRQSVLVNWVKEGGFPDVKAYKEINALLAKLSPEEKEILAGIVQEARDGGIHDTLAYLQDEIVLNGLRLEKSKVILPVEPFDTELYYDWVSRCEGDEWPDEK